MLTGLGLSRNFNSKITINASRIAVRSRHSFMGIQEYWTTHGLSDEAWFHLSGYTSSQNTRLWGSENPHALFEEPLHSQKVGVFCALLQRRIIGPMFFDTTVTSQLYIELFREFVNQSDNQELTFGYYQQDGAISHTSGVSMAEVE
jgi:hypothetical protein